MYLYIHLYMPRSAGAAWHTDCISAEGRNTSNECPKYNTRQSDSEATVILELWEMRSTPSIAITLRTTLARCDNT